ncbi:hypothetical protein A6R68_24280, partial [Neotoma lepida]
DSPTVVVEDLRLCTVKHCEDIERRFCFEKLDKKSSPSTGSLDSGNESKEKLLKGESALQRVQCIPGNTSCCDCGLADPRWASINLGITLCIECSGIH